MGAARRACARARELSRAPNCSGRFVARSLYRLPNEPVIKAHILAKSGSAEWARDRHREHARSAVAARRLDEYLHLQRCARGHVGRARLRLSTPLHHSLDERSDRAARMGCEIFRREFPAIGSRTIAIADLT